MQIKLRTQARRCHSGRSNLSISGMLVRSDKTKKEPRHCPGLVNQTYWPALDLIQPNELISYRDRNSRGYGGGVCCLVVSECPKHYRLAIGKMTDAECR